MEVNSVWTPLSSPPPIGISTMVLLTDGRVFCREDDGTEAGGRRWFLLAPSSTGSYVEGGWTDLALWSNARRYYASAVLGDGKVFVAGGENSDAGADLNAAESFDPLIGTWSQLSTPAGLLWGTLPVAFFPTVVCCWDRFFVPTRQSMTRYRAAGQPEPARMIEALKRRGRFWPTALC